MTRRNHVVPIHYLTGFATENGRISQVRLADAAPREVSVKDAMVRRDFYTLEIEGELSDELETLLGQAESLAASPLRRLASGAADFSVRDREAVAAWAALQHLRGPDMRVMLSDLMNIILKGEVLAGGRERLADVLRTVEGREPTPTEVEEAWQSMSDTDAWTVAALPEHHVTLMRDLIKPATYSFLVRPWTVLRFSHRRLGTSDTPLVLVPHPSSPLGPTAGLFNAALVLLPLARDSLLVMGPLPDDPDAVPGPVTVRQGTAQWELVVNRITAGHARSVVLHHPDDEPFRNIELGEPRTREVSGEAELLDLVRRIGDES
jgi:hypothetical protein